MTELLLELYSEEIPALMQSKAEEVFKKLFCDAFFSKNINFEDLQVFSGPCRITIHVKGLIDQIPGHSVEKKGPRVEADSQAIAGFAKSIGQEVSALEVQEIKGVKCYIYREDIPAQPISNILPELICRVLAEYTWPKSMYWSEHKFAWVRPLKNILCLLGSEADSKVLDFKFNHLQSNNITYGHKFLKFSPLTVNSFSEYKQVLKKNFVELCRSVRKSLILEQIDKILTTHKLTLNADDKLLEEVVGLVEYPQALLGQIPQKFLAVPHEILTSAMRLHQKYFTVRNEAGDFAPYFIFVANIDSSEVVTRGNERVLSARLSDAKFFFDIDLKTSLDDMYGKLSRVIFHAKLGSLKDKSVRLEAIVKFLFSNDNELSKAAKFCKCDLVSGVVSEFPELQGIMGGYYALNAEFSQNVAEIITDHYKPLGPNDSVPRGAAAYLSIADKIDSLVGLYMAGERASGSGDPFALRRYALGIINSILANGFQINLQQLIEFATLQYAPLKLENIDNKTSKLILAFLEERAKNLLKDRFEIGLVNALVKFSIDSDLMSVARKLESLQEFINSSQGKNLLQSFKRAFNILSQEEKRFKAGITSDIDESLLQQEEEFKIVSFIKELELKVGSKLLEGRYDEALVHLAALYEPLDHFFSKVTVITPDLNIAQNRLAILKTLVKIFNKFAKFDDLI